MSELEFQQMSVALKRLLTAITDEAELIPESVLLAAKALCDLIVSTAERKKAFEA